MVYIINDMRHIYIHLAVDDIVAVFINKTEGDKVTGWVDDPNKQVEVKISKAVPKPQKSGIPKSGNDQVNAALMIVETKQGQNNIDDNFLK